MNSSLNDNRYYFSRGTPLVNSLVNKVRSSCIVLANAFKSSSHEPLEMVIGQPFSEIAYNETVASKR